MCHNTSVPCHHLLFDALVCKYVSRATMCRGPWQGPVIAPFPSPSEHPATSRIPIEARWSRARAALLHADQLRSAAAPSHWDCHQMNESCKSMLFVKCSTSGDVPSQTIRMSKAEYTVTSCQPGLDHSSSKLSMSLHFGSAAGCTTTQAATAAGTRDAEPSRTPLSRHNAPSTNP